MVASRQPSATSVQRDAWVEVDLGALEANVRVVRSWLPSSVDLMAVVKSDAYGHGAAGIAPVLLAAGARWLGVASVDEGLQLRHAGIRAPILILSPCPFWAMSAAVEAGLDVTVTAMGQVKDLMAAAQRLGKAARVHIKVDSGMHRLGVDPADTAEVARAICGSELLTLAGLFSHLARPDHDGTTAWQNDVFRTALQSVVSCGVNPQIIHLASGESARRFPETHYDLVRVGLYLYGLEPRAVSEVVTPAMSLRARIVQLKEIDAGESVGYDLTWSASRRSRIASIPVGYGDGVDRRLSNRMTGLLMGTQVKQVGLISMDQMLFDVTDVPQAGIGDIITLLGCESGLPAPQDAFTGRAINLAAWATVLETITYELACRLRVRLPRVYTRHNTTTVKSGKR